MTVSVVVLSVLSLLAVPTRSLNADQIDTDSLALFSSPLACASAQLYSGGACVVDAECATHFFNGGALLDPAMTQAPIAAVPGRVLGLNAIELVVEHPAVRDRVLTGIVIAENRTACNYPGPHWRKAVFRDALNATATLCHDLYVSSIPWSENCDLARDENATHVVFTGNVTVTYEDSLGEFDGVPLGARAVASVVRFAVVQPKVIRDIATTVAILDEPRLLGAVTRQTFDYKTNRATLTVALSLAAPLRTTSNAAAVPPAGIALIPLGGNDTLCPDRENAVCQQRYSFLIDPQRRCDLDGTYDFDFVVACQPSVVGTPSCPVNDTLKPLRLRIVVDSEDICTVVQGLLAAEGLLTSHASFTAGNATFAFGEPKRAFFQSDPLHFQLTLKSLNLFEFEASSIILVEALDVNGDRRTIFDADAPASANDWAFVSGSDPLNAAGNTTTHRHGFSFTARPSVFGNVTRGLPVDSRVIVSASVVFANPTANNGTTRRRAIVRRQVSMAKLVGAEAVFQVVQSVQNETTRFIATHVEPSITPFIVGGIVVGAILIAAIGALVFWRRRAALAENRGETHIVALPQSQWENGEPLSPRSQENPVHIVRTPNYLLDSGNGRGRRMSDFLRSTFDRFK